MNPLIYYSQTTQTSKSKTYVEAIFVRKTSIHMALRELAGIQKYAINLKIRFLDKAAP